MTADDLRKRALAQLADLGDRRKKLMAELDAIDTDLKPLVAEAYDAGAGYRDLGAATGLASRSIHAWTRDTQRARTSTPRRAAQ